jgi:Flp pilus assembly protein protease CpaA
MPYPYPRCRPAVKCSSTTSAGSPALLLFSSLMGPLCGGAASADTQCRTMLTITIATIMGCVAGGLIAVLLDRLYTGTSWRGPVVLPAGRRYRLPGGGRVPARLLYLPLLGGVAFSVAAMAAEGRQLWLTLLFALPLMALTAADLERRLLPNRIMYPALLAALLLGWVWPGREVVDVLIGGVAGFGVMFALFLLLPGFGFGDVKLAGLLGLLSGLTNLLPALTVATLAAGAGSLLLLLLGRAKLRSVVAYGPYLALGAFWGMLAGG